MQAIFFYSTTMNEPSLGVNECNPQDALDIRTELARMYNHNEWNSYYQMSTCQTDSNSIFQVFSDPFFLSLNLSHYTINFHSDNF